MEKTLVIFKPSSIERALVGQILTRFQQKGLVIAGIKMMQLTEEIPVLVMCRKGRDAIKVVRLMTGATNGREALPGTIRGDFSMSGQENIIHASSSPEDAEAEVKRFFAPDEIFDWMPQSSRFTYSPDELN